MNLTEKIVQRVLVGGAKGKVSAGDFVSIKPKHVMTHDNTSAVMGKFLGLNATRFANPHQPVFTLDHNVQDKSDTNLEKYASIKAFATQHGVDFYPAGRGIGHQVLVEEGYAFPGSVVVASDSHSNMYGGVGCLGTPVVRTDAASIWATGQTWWQVPPVARVELNGKLNPGVTGKDIIITLCGHFNNDEVLNHAIEFRGSGVASLSVEERLTIANMTTEWGALTGLFPVDHVTVEWLKGRAEYLKTRGYAGVPSEAKYEGEENIRVNKASIADLEALGLEADEDATYAKTLRLDLSTVSPHVSGPNTLKVMNSAAYLESQDIKIHKAYIVSCVNSRVGDLAQAAKVLKGNKVAEGVELYVAPASTEVQAESEARGDWKSLLDAGAIALPAGCGPCIGLGTGLLEDGEVGISATNRNFKGRMGSPEALAYLASPAAVAASAIAGKIVSPLNKNDSELRASIDEASSSTGEAGGERTLSPLAPGFPEEVSSGAVFCDMDNINTDGIYPGKYTYRDDVSEEEMGKVAMENYDKHFGEVASNTDILISGFNFGTGSSREQAATALKLKGIPLVLAGSFSATYTRNAINNGYLVLECPTLVEKLRASKSGETVLTEKVSDVTVDFKNWEAVMDGERFPISPVGAAAQELIVEGGLEQWVRNRAE